MDMDMISLSTAKGLTKGEFATRLGDSRRFGRMAGCPVEARALLSEVLERN